MKKTVLTLALLAAMGNAHAIAIVAAHPVVVPHVSVPVAPHVTVAPHVVEPIAAPHATVVAHEETVPHVSGSTVHSPTYTPVYSHSSAASGVEATKSSDDDFSTYVIAAFVGLMLALVVIAVFF